MRIFFLILSVLFITSITTQADEFKPVKTIQKKINCSNENGLILISGIKTAHKPYEQNTKNLKLIECQKVQINNQEFYTLQFSVLEEQQSVINKIMLFEIAIFDEKKKSLTTVRSEIVDRVKLNSDLPDYNFENTLKLQWGLSTRDKKVMLKIEISSKNKAEKPDTYLIKLNQKNTWFENVF